MNAAAAVTLPMRNKEPDSEPGRITLAMRGAQWRKRCHRLLNSPHRFSTRRTGDRVMRGFDHLAGGAS
jgi:hypothetical protein